MAQPDYPGAAAAGLMWAVASDPDHDGDDDSKPETDTDHDWWSTDGRPMRSQAASGLPQVQQHTDPNNQPDPEGDELPVGVAFPLGDNSPGSTFRQQWSTGPQGPQPRAASRRQALDMSAQHANLMGHADAMANQSPSHKDEFGQSKQKHRRYLEGWNQTAGLIHGLVGRAPMSKEEYASKTGRADLHAHYLSAYAQGRAMHGQSNSLYRADAEGQATASLHVQADAWSQPRRTTDDFSAPYNTPQTSPDPWSQQQSSDFQAGVSAGQADRSTGERPLFADNSSGVSPYVKGYAQGYGAGGGPQGPQDVPLSMGGDSGQAYNAQEAQRAFQVARASRRTAAHEELNAHMQLDHGVAPGSGDIGDHHMILHERGNADHFYESYPEDGRTARRRTAKLRRVSAAFAPDSLMSDSDFRKGYLFARRWRPGQRLAGKGTAAFEAGIYSGVTDSPGIQQAWLAAHSKQAARHPELGRRIGLHRSFTRKHARANRIKAQGVYVRQAGTSTDLITDGPGTSPDPMGSTPLNGPGSPPPMGGLSDPAQAGGAPPYQGAPPLPGGPVVPNDVMGQPQQQPQPNGPTVQTYSGMHPENVLLAPAAPNRADQSGYTNRDAYRGDPRGTDRLAAFRTRVQAGMRHMASNWDGIENYDPDTGVHRGYTIPGNPGGGREPGMPDPDDPDWQRQEERYRNHVPADWERARGYDMYGRAL